MTDRVCGALKGGHSMGTYQMPRMNHCRMAPKFLFPYTPLLQPCTGTLAKIALASHTAVSEFVWGTKLWPMKKEFIILRWFRLLNRRISANKWMFGGFHISNKPALTVIFYPSFWLTLHRSAFMEAQALLWIPKVCGSNLRIRNSYWPFSILCTKLRYLVTGLGH